MRLMLGTPGDPRLLVRVADDFDPVTFKFSVINGAWDGVFTNGHITVLGDPSGDWSDLGMTEILTDNQDRLRCDFTVFTGYDTVFTNFHNPSYVAPEYKRHTNFDDMDDDIPF